MIPKLDPDKFYRAFETIRLVEEGAVRPIRSLAGQKMVVEGVEYAFTDNPLLRMVEAIRIVFPDPVEGAAASARMFNLFEVCTQPGPLQKLLQMKDGNLMVHASLVHALAQVDMDEESRFDPDQLVELVKRILRESLSPAAESAG